MLINSAGRIGGPLITFMFSRREVTGRPWYLSVQYGSVVSCRLRPTTRTRIPPPLNNFALRQHECGRPQISYRTARTKQPKQAAEATQVTYLTRETPVVAPRQSGAGDRFRPPNPTAKPTLTVRYLRVSPP